MSSKTQFLVLFCISCTFRHWYCVFISVCVSTTLSHLSYHPFALFLYVPFQLFPFLFLPGSSLGPTKIIKKRSINLKDYPFVGWSTLVPQIRKSDLLYEFTCINYHFIFTSQFPQWRKCRCRCRYVCRYVYIISSSAL